MISFPSSWLFTPGSRPDRFEKALATETEAVILDLEDAVSEAEKAPARQTVLDFLSGLGEQETKPICVRINPLGRIHGLQDLCALSLLPRGPDYILIPKSEVPAELALADHVLSDQKSRIQFIALIESANGICQAAAIAASTPRLTALMFGAADYAADLGQQVGSFNADFARQSIINAAASGGIATIDSPFFAIDNPTQLTAESAGARAMGFTGKAAIHPSQIAIINDAFRPTEEEKQLASRILESVPDGVGMLDGKMIDIAMVRWARRLSGS